MEVLPNGEASPAVDKKEPAKKKKAAPKTEAKTETKKEEKKAAPKTEKKAAPKKSTPAKTGDDLTKIEGIGPKIAEVFGSNGISSYADLSGSKVGDLRTILADNGLSQHDPSSWKKQATLAKNGKRDELKTLQDELDGGK